MEGIARILIFAGIVLVVAGGLILLFGRIPGIEPGRLPGDLSWEKGSTKFFAPLGTMLLISIVLTILLNVILRLFR